MVGWHHCLNGHEFEETLGDSEGQGSLECCSPWGHVVRHKLATEQPPPRYPWCFASITPSTHHTHTHTLLISFLVPPHLVVFGTEPSFTLSSLSFYCNRSRLKSAFTILTTIQLYFSLKLINVKLNVKLTLNSKQGLKWFLFVEN